MSLLLTDRDEESGNPIELIEKVAIANDWPYYRHSDDELAIEIEAQWTRYRVNYSWQAELGILHISCPFDMKIQASHHDQICQLLALANEKLWIGHFDFFWDDGVPMFRHATLFREGTQASVELIEDLLDIAVSECDRFYPAFQFVLWSGKTAKEAITNALLETEGEA